MTPAEGPQASAPDPALPLGLDRVTEFTEAGLRTKLRSAAASEQREFYERRVSPTGASVPDIERTELPEVLIRR